MWLVDGDIAAALMPTVLKIAPQVYAQIKAHFNDRKLDDGMLSLMVTLEMNATVVAKLDGISSQIKDHDEVSKEREDAVYQVATQVRGLLERPRRK